MPIQLDFILRRLAEMAEADPSLRDRQPWKAAHERDYAWLARVMAEHYAGDDTNVRTVGAGIVAAFANITVDEFEASADAFLRSASHPTLGLGYLECAYAPMVELLAHLRGQRVRELHRLRRRPRLHAPDQRRGLRHPPRGRDRQCRRPRVHPRRARGRDHPPGGRRLPRRRPREAGAHLDPHRPASGAGCRQLQRRHRDARLHPAPRTSRPCGSWSCTTTPSASSTTSPAPRTPSTARPAATGRWSA